MIGFFSAQPSPAPKQKDIFIVAGSFQVANVKGTANEAEVYVICRILGRLDSSLQLVRPSVDAPGSSAGGGINYNLVRTDKRWEFSPDGNALKQVTGPPEWRLRDFQPTLYLSVSTAMHYLLEMRSQAADLTVKKNAEMTAATLLRLNANPQAFAAVPPQGPSHSLAPQH